MGYIKNDFQRFFQSKEAVPLMVEIIKLYHPDHPDEWHSVSGKTTWKIDDPEWIGFKYDWVTIRTNRTYVDIGIEFHNSLWGPNHKFEAFEKQLETENFRSWRFVGDKGYVNQEWNLEDGTKTPSDEEYNLTPQLLKLFEKYKVPKPTAKQLFDYYYED